MPRIKPSSSSSNTQTVQASIVPAGIPIEQLVPMHVEDLKLPTDPNAAPLSDQELKAALEAGMVNKHLTTSQLGAFRKMRQRRIYPEIDGQRFAVISWVPSTKAKPDEDNCYGLMRIAGCFSTSAEANKHAEALLRTDSLREFLITYVGLDFPLTSDDFGVLRREEVDLQTKTEDMERLNLRKQEEQEEEKTKEIENQREALLQDVTRKRTPDDLDTYIELCVKQANSESERARALDKIDKCNRVVASTQPLLEAIIANHPEYREEAAKAYEAACNRVGIDAKQNAVAAFLDFSRLQSHTVIKTEVPIGLKVHDGAISVTTRTLESVTAVPELEVAPEPVVSLGSLSVEDHHQYAMTKD